MKCPDACEVINFEVQTSFATLSSQSKDQLLSMSNKLASLSRNFYHAREVEARANNTVVETVEHVARISTVMKHLINYVQAHNPTKKGSFHDLAVRAIKVAVKMVHDDVSNILGGLPASWIADFDSSYGQIIRKFTAATNTISSIMHDYIAASVPMINKDMNGTILESFLAWSISLGIAIEEATNKGMALDDEDPSLQYLRSVRFWVPRSLYASSGQSDYCVKVKEEIVTDAKTFKDYADSILPNSTTGLDGQTYKLKRNVELKKLNQYYKKYESSMVKIERCLDSYLKKISNIETWSDNNLYVTNEIDEILNSMTTTLNMEQQTQDLVKEEEKLKKLVEDFGQDKVKMREIANRFDDREKDRIIQKSKTLMSSIGTWF